MAQLSIRARGGQGGDLCGEILPASLAQLPTEKHRRLDDLQCPPGLHGRWEDERL
ncbi:unnamed protein product [Cladocopium goreaui]|uniref:Uncharacterized protein n=1 Tax=Cladocopium goreaui TaxID=2562237 RepID=A0A9P1FVW8_9DINO|nr:unnamed protein product [Cladocopium goreaui]